MIIDRQREKLVEAVVYFALHTRNLGKTKLFKLLYFLDFKHYRDTGRAVTGLDYFAWPKGPVPVKLFEELQQPEVSWGNSVSFRPKAVAKGSMLTVTAHKQFDPSLFTKRELKILESLATQYRDVYADDMVEATHLENLPWDKVWNQEGRRQQPIPYSYALRAQDYETMTAFVDEREEFLRVMSK
ncbi:MULTISPECIES: Panacea domain-containing protein [unclassified Polaromonas]|uniref:Panacea domain-containing protein n=1 Tax=unclassified Polaromonas TaxID=2638319 RepID=UPI000F090790|nr:MULTISPECIES: Panacea domain-containing protein [unclassified Polaromonas]AYQ26820.1 DUF4065 domain-containing protein [Polaromonas sp. SP1]QGJ18335.1 DUF4065 domain-containing protein [Polaromonas sp. Pch-P]